MNLLDLSKEKIVIFDGAMGTNIQKKKLSEEDFWGKPDCNEILNLSRPEAIAEIHAAFLEVGCDVIETNSFNGTPISLAENSLSDRAYEINKKAGEIAKKVATEFSTKSHPRFVAGSMGPTAKLPTLGQIAFEEMLEAYKVQARGLIDGGVDSLILETCQDILQAKIGIIAILDVFKETGKKLPLQVSVTINESGKMLLGTDMGSAMTTLLAYPIDTLGINCSTGPAEMSETLHSLSENSPIPISAIPNAGFPKEVNGELVYDLSPQKMAEYLQRYVHNFHINILGGCCGTTPEHLKAIVEAVGNLSPKKREVQFATSLSSLYSRVFLDMDPKPFLIGERTNANGSKKFRELLKNEDFDEMVSFGKAQIARGAHALDLSVAVVGRNEVSDMREVVSRFNRQLDTPLMIDSTNPESIEAALQKISGKAIVNSINLENGEKEFAKILGLCKRYGAAVVALSIDERGMAKTAQKKLEIAERIFDLATHKYNFNPKEILYDPLTFTLATGEEKSRKMGVETLFALNLIKGKIPNSKIILGVSNISYGLPKNARKALNSVFLHEAVKEGLDFAIFNIAHFLPLHKIDEKAVELCLNLIYDRSHNALSELIEYFSTIKGEEKASLRAELSPAEELQRKIMDGDKIDLEKIITNLLKSHKPSEVVNEILLPGMEKVGELFGRGEMPLPFVLESAEVMKESVKILEPFMKKLDSSKQGTFLLATVKGDVHDIGKNLVIIILSNNGFRVVDLGIRQPISEIIAGIKEHKPDAIGMSGLLVKSTLIMKENLEILREKGIEIPVILGGAALTRSFVENTLQKSYGGKVYYAKDAFEGLRILRKIT